MLNAGMRVKNWLGNTLARLTVAGGLAAVTALAILACLRPVRVIKCDPRFHLFTVKVLRSADEHFYLGNQLEGRARYYLRRRFGLNIQTLPDLASFSGGQFGARLPDHSSILAIQFRSEKDPATFGALPLQAELVDNGGRRFRAELRRLVKKDSYFAIWDLDQDRTRGGPYRVKIEQGDNCLVEFDLRNLPSVQPFHLGPNAF